MTNLSPQAQAVLDAFICCPVEISDQLALTAALRALVIQLQYYQCCEDEGVEDMVLDARAILNVAKELENV